MQLGPIQRLFRLAIQSDRTRRVVNRVAAKNEKLLDTAGVDLRRQLQNAAGSSGFRQIAQKHGCAEIFQRGIDPIDHQLHDDRLMRTGHDQACAGFRKSNPAQLPQASRSSNLAGLIGAFSVTSTEDKPGSLVATAILRRERMGDRRDLARGIAETVIGHRAGQSETVLDNIEPIHRVLCFAHSPPRGESADGSEIAFAAIKEIAIERENYVRFVELRNYPACCRQN